MAMGEIGAELRPLTVTDPDTGRLLTAKVYTIEGVEGTFSMGQVVFAVCMAIALEREQKLVDVMEEIDNITDQLQTSTDIQAALVDWFNEAALKDNFNLEFGEGVAISYQGRVYSGKEWRDFLWEVLEISKDILPSGDSLTRDQVETLIDGISDKMDSLNAVNNDQLIKMQSETAKRDQAFDLLSNILKSFNTELVGNANNL